MLNIRHDMNGVVNETYTKLVWLTSTINTTGWLDKFAVNLVPDSTGNYVEFYIYNNVQWAGYKVSVEDKSQLDGKHLLTFTGDVTRSATTTLTALPSNGTIIYSTLGYYLQSVADMRAAIVAIGGSI